MKNSLKILVFILFFSCDDKINELEELNISPNIHYFSRTSTSWQEIKETKTIFEEAKTYDDEGKMMFKIALKIEDINHNYAYLKIESLDKENQFWVNDNYYYENIKVPLDSFSFAYRSFQSGVKEINLKATDDFGKSINLDFQVTFKDNLSPLADLKINQISILDPNEYELNGELSIDEDTNIGGFIKQYEFIINTSIIKTSSAKINHVFNTGQHEIKLRVQDNNNAWSDTKTKQLNIP